MQTRTITIKRGDRSPSIAAVLKDRDGPIQLAGCAVKIFTTNRASGIVKIGGGSVSILDPDAALVRYDFTDADVDTAAVYNLEWEITMPSGKKTTIPNGGYDRLIILADLG